MAATGEPPAGSLSGALSRPLCPFASCYLTYLKKILFCHYASDVGVIGFLLWVEEASDQRSTGGCQP